MCFFENMDFEKIIYSAKPAILNNFSGKLLFLLLVAIVSLFIAALVFELIRIILKRSLKSSGTLINQKLRAVFYTFFVVVGLNLSLPAANLEGLTEVYVHKILYILFIACFAFLLIQVCKYIKGLIYERHDITIANNLTERKVRTQIGFIYKLAVVIIFIIAVSVILMSFQPVRELGTSILASAGIAGVIIGFAAQKSLANLLAGFQIAFTQPIRIDDVVIVEGEWGRIEEISLTYVVVRIWDQRRLIVPISHFIEKPFQNWTRISSDLLGTVFFYADYSLPIDEIRKELTRILQSSDKWDGKVNVVQVTDATERTVQVRALMSSQNSGDAWDLRCLVREKLIEFVQKNYPESLPKMRAEMGKPELNLDSI